MQVIPVASPAAVTRHPASVPSAVWPLVTQDMTDMTGRFFQADIVTDNQTLIETERMIRQTH